MRRTSHVREYVRRKHGLADHGGPVSEHDRGYTPASGIQSASEMAKGPAITKDWLLENLPHGSGIDRDWYIEDKGSHFEASNAFSTMDEAGYYGPDVDFYVKIPKDYPMSFSLHFSGVQAQYYAKKYGLRDYLEEVFNEELYHSMLGRFP